MPAEEVKDPEKTIPQATYLGTIVTTLIYIVATVAVMGIIPLSALQTSNAPFADAAQSIFGGSWGKWVAVVGMISAFGALNGWTLLTARISLAAANDGLFPKFFGRVSGKRRTPVYGLIAAAVLVTGLVFMNYTNSLVDQFTFMLLLATLTTVVPYAFAAAAEIALFVREPQRFTGRKMLRDTIVAGLGFGYAIWAMYATGSESIAKGYLLMMLGIPLYLYLRWRRQQQDRTATGPSSTGPSRWRSTRTGRRRCLLDATGRIGGRQFPPGSHRGTVPGVTTPPATRDRPVFEEPIVRRDAERLRSIAGAEEGANYDSLVRTVRATLRGHTVWQINATAEGGGVAELLRSCLGYLADDGIATRWLVIDADPAFFETTRNHNGSTATSGTGDRWDRRNAPTTTTWRGRTCARSSPWWPPTSWRSTTRSRSGLFPVWLFGLVHRGVDLPRGDRDPRSTTRPPP